MCGRALGGVGVADPDLFVEGVAVVFEVRTEAAGERTGGVAVGDVAVVGADDRGATCVRGVIPLPVAWSRAPWIPRVQPTTPAAMAPMPAMSRARRGRFCT